MHALARLFTCTNCAQVVNLVRFRRYGLLAQQDISPVVDMIITTPHILVLMNPSCEVTVFFSSNFLYYSNFILLINY
jgi:hypothetical protein